MGKSLAEQIAQLTKPQAEYDIEDNELRDNVFEHDEDESSGVSDNELEKEHYVNVSKSKLRQNDINLGKKYTGTVTSRSELYDDEAEVSGDDEEEVDEEAGEDFDDSDSGASLRADSEDEDEDSEDESDNQNQEERDEELEHKRMKVKELMSKERTHIVSRLSQSATNDSLKGFAISQQHKIFDKVIDTRLKIQKSLTSSNLLPPNSDTLTADNLSTKKTAKYLAKAKEDCYDLLDSILALRSHFYTKDQIVAKAPAQQPKKRTFLQYTKAASKFDTVLDQYRATVLTKWSAKVQNSSGSSAINAGKFKSINQSFEQQVTNNLSDIDRLVKRTKLNRRQITPLGYDYYKKQMGESASEGEEEEEENPDIPKEVKSKQDSIAEIDEIFDDEDFYRVLLNDLVDKKIQSSNPTTGMTISLRSAQQAQKFKKNVDTKASKGRKLRYHVQEPIANFEAPSDGWRWDDNQIDEFFASLLGQKVNMNEVDEAREDDDDEIEVEADGIKLFG